MDEREMFEAWWNANETWPVKVENIAFLAWQAARRTTPDREAWQPIETAPKDGRTLLLGYPNACGKWRTVRGQWMSQNYINEYWEDPDNVEPGWFETPDNAEEPPNCWGIDPTHWMPMPAAPTSDKGGA